MNLDRRWMFPGGIATLLLPAVLGQVEIEGPAGVSIGCLPEPEWDVREPPIGAGSEVVAALGEGRDG